MDKSSITLTRDDLRKSVVNLPKNDIICYCFKSSSITLDEMRKAEVINFVDDDGTIKELKNRCRTY